MQNERPDPYIRNCLTCGVELNNPFLRWSDWWHHKISPFCSSDCFYIARTDMFRKKHNAFKEPSKSKIAGKRLCDHCGTEFKPKNRNNYCCSPQCRALFNDFTRKRNYKPTMEDKPPMTLYNATKTLDGIRFAKFDENMDLVATYIVKGNSCDCPAAHRPTCKHRKMVSIFTAVQAIDTDQFYDYDNKRWERVADTNYDEVNPEQIRAMNEYAKDHTVEVSLPPDALTDKAEVHLEIEPKAEPSSKPWRRL